MTYYPPVRLGELKRGDVVRWFDYLGQQDREGEVVRVARDGTWGDVRYPITASIFPDVTHSTRRVRVTKLRMVKRAESPPSC